MDKKVCTILNLELHFSFPLMDVERLFISDCLDSQVSQIFKMLSNKYLPHVKSIDFKDVFINE